MIRVFSFLFIFLFPLLSEAQPKRVILMIGDGMGLSQAYCTYTANKGKLNMFSMPVTGFSKTHCADRYNTDSGAGATALAIGYKANYEAIGLDSLSNSHPSLIKLAKRKGLATGIITTCDLTHATPAGFVSNVKNRKMQEEIALSYLDENVDVFIGGGLNNFLANKRKDKISLTDSLIKKGYKMAYSLEELMGLKIDKSSLRVAGLLYDKHPPLAKKREDMLCKSFNKALEVLSKDKDGFFIMLEGSQIDFEAHLNNMENMIEEVLDFDKAVGLAIEFAKKNENTLVIVIADHETGGLTISDGNFKTGDVKGKWATNEHTGIMVPIYAFGKGAESFTGIMENTDVFYKIKQFLGI